MKEWATEHPIMTFLLVVSAIDGVVSVFRAVSGIFSPKAISAEPNEECEEA